ncbi:MAG: cyclase family protein [Deltaproteobacteria bacterium]|nr:cyclase family protein [Deltaproteobacteria bacterium]
MFRPELKELITEGKIYDLGQPWHPGMPHHPLHPPFVFGLARKHGDVLYEGGGSSANDLFAFGGHTGTHLDAVGHISKSGVLFGGIEAAQEQDYLTGLSRRSIEETPPIIARGILLDIPGLKQVGVLEKGYPIRRKDIQETLALQKVKIEAGDVVLVSLIFGYSKLSKREDPHPFPKYHQRFGWGRSGHRGGNMSPFSHRHPAWQRGDELFLSSPSPGRLGL